MSWEGGLPRRPASQETDQSSNATRFVRRWGGQEALMNFPTGRLLTAVLPLIYVSLPLALAQADEMLPEIVVTATRSPTAISNAGSSISVISAEEIVRSSPRDIIDALRTVPGVDITTTGGPGSAASVRIRGAESKNTLVLIDGVRVNDPSDAGGGFDMSAIVPTDIERIEVLRGPQSALYGSDAMGGVINIITRKGQGKPRVKMSAEGGSYGSKGLSGSVSGREGPVSYAFSVNGYDTAGFSRYGYRIGRIEKKFPWGLENDSNQRIGASGKVTVGISDTSELEFGGYSSLSVSDYDSAFGQYPDTPSRSRQGLLNGYVRLKNLMFDGRLTNRFTVSGNATDRKYRSITYYGVPPITSWTNDHYRGSRVAAEYQGDLKLDQFGIFTLGAKTEKEDLISYSQNIEPIASMRSKTGDFSQVTNSVYAMHQVSPLTNLHLSLGGRIDAIDNGNQFNTWRATAAYEIPETRTTLRASVGTGAKAPSLFQLHDATYGNPDLKPEYSVGFDAGIDQKLFDDKLLLSATFFSNRFRDMIDFTFDPETCPSTSPYGCYLNVARARTWGIEFSGDLELVPDLLRVRAAYTYMHSVNGETDLRLPRRPEHEGRLGLVITPIEKLSIEPSLVMVGERFSSVGEKDRLAPYARLDMRVEYRIDETFSVYARAENLTDANYQEVLNYGTPGRSIYGGVRATW